MAIFDQARRKRGKRQQRERGAWVYIPQEILAASGREHAADGGAPFYRVWTSGKGRVWIQLYDRE